MALVVVVIMVLVLRVVMVVSRCLDTGYNLVMTLQSEPTFGSLGRWLVVKRVFRRILASLMIRRPL